MNDIKAPALAAPALAAPALAAPASACRFPNGREPLKDEEMAQIRVVVEELVKQKYRAADLFLQSEALRAEAVRIVHRALRTKEDLVQEIARKHEVPLDEGALNPGVRWDVDLDEGCFVRHVVSGQRRAG